MPGTRLRDYLGAWRLARAGPERTVADCLDPRSPLWRRFWDPLARAVLNTPPEQGSARLLWAALRESFARGGAGCRPLIARDSLAASLIDPALRAARRSAASRSPSASGCGRCRARAAGRRASTSASARSSSAPDDQVILALPPGQTGALLPEIPVPAASHAIVNGHFRLARPARLPGGSPLLGLIGGTAEWLFLRDELVSLTVSAADALAEEPSASDRRAPLGRYRARAGPAGSAAAAGADRQGAARDLRPDAGGGRAPARRDDRLAEPAPRRRLDRDRAAGDDRGRGALGPARGRARALRRLAGGVTSLTER